MGQAGGRKKAEANFFFDAPIIQREFLKCSLYSVCHQKILGLSTCHGQLHKMNVAATNSWVRFKDFSEYAAMVFIVSSGKETEPPHERGKADNLVPAFPHGSLTAGRWAAEQPNGLRYPPQVYYYCQLVH